MYFAADMAKGRESAKSQKKIASASKSRACFVLHVFSQRIPPAQQRRLFLPSQTNLDAK
jgi:hypothetical protein